MVYSASQLAGMADVNLMTFLRHVESGGIPAPTFRGGKRFFYSEDEKQRILTYWDEWKVRKGNRWPKRTNGLRAE